MFKSTLKLTALSLGLILFMGSRLSFAGAIDEIQDEALRNEVKASISKGEQYPVFIDRSESAWPEVYIYQPVRSTPEEAAALFTHYEYQVNYIPMLKKVVITKPPVSPTVDMVTYTVGLPFGFGSETYTVLDSVSAYTVDAGKSYKVAWDLVEADTLKELKGDVRFEAYGSETLMVYHNFVNPTKFGSSWSWVVSQAKEGMKDTANKIVQQVEEVKAKDPALMQERINILHSRGL